MEEVKSMSIIEADGQKELVVVKEERKTVNHHMLQTLIDAEQRNMQMYLAKAEECRERMEQYRRFLIELYSQGVEEDGKQAVKD